jgi:midasin
MRQPITTHLQPIFAGDPECKPVEIGFNAEVPIAMERPSFPVKDTALTVPHLVDLDRTYRKFDAFITNRIERWMRLHSVITIDDLATDIIVTARNLASESIPRDLSAARRDKQHKALLVRKRKAWSDLLKELKRGGLSVNMKPDVLRQQCDPLWIREQPIISAAVTQLISTVKVDLYFDRLQSALPQLRASVSDHHSDVTTKELQRAVMLLESGFAFALEARSRYVCVVLFSLSLLTMSLDTSLAVGLEVYAKFDQLSRRLHAISTSKTTAFDLPLFDGISRFRTIACKLADALNEVVCALITFHDLQPNPSIISPLVEDVRIVAIKASASRDRLTGLILDLEVNSSLILIDSTSCFLITDAPSYFPPCRRIRHDFGH